jgi:hypothetical protein
MVSLDAPFGDRRMRMTLSQMIQHLKQEREKAMSEVRRFDAAIVALTESATLSHPKRRWTKALDLDS